MNPASLKTMRTTTCLFFFLISFYIIHLTGDYRPYSSSTYYASIFPIAAALLVAALIILAVRTTIVTWITLLVLLAFAGNHRRILVKNGRKITSEVAMHLIKVVIRERGIAVAAFATVASLMVMAWLRKIA